MPAPSTNEPPAPRPLHPLPHGRAVGVVLAFSVAVAGCNHGRQVVTAGTVHAADLCAPEPAPTGDAPEVKSTCPPCSTRDATGRCRDAYYEHGTRCRDDGDCAGGRCALGFCVLHDDDRDELDDDLE